MTQRLIPLQPGAWIGIVGGGPGRLGLPTALAAAARQLVEDITAGLDLVGVLAVELFLTHDGRLLVNELAPRPHNSGHYTLDACATSQFEQLLRAICHLPLGAPDLLRRQPPWPTCSATSGRSRTGTRTGPWRWRSPGSSCTSTARPTPARAGGRRGTGLRRSHGAGGAAGQFCGRGADR